MNGKKFFSLYALDSATFLLKRTRASCHTREVSYSFRARNEGRRSCEKRSEASRGSSVGRWSIEMMSSSSLGLLTRLL